MGGEADLIIARGPKRAIRFAVCADGSSPARDFYEHGLDESERPKLQKLFRTMADVGCVTNPEKFKKEQGEIWAFKSYQVRFPCFQDGNDWVLTHGYRKKKDRWMQSHIDRAERIRAEHFHRKRKLMGEETTAGRRGNRRGKRRRGR